MADKVTVEIEGLDALFNKLSKLEKPLDRSTASKMGAGTVSEMKNLIKGGISPVRGNGFGGRFPPYKNPAKYPAGRKPPRPVNLKLDHKFLKDLVFKVGKDRLGSNVTVGYFVKLSVDKELGHRNGQNGQPKRPTIPNPSKGEQFSSVIDERIVSIVTKRIRELTK